MGEHLEIGDWQGDAARTGLQREPHVKPEIEHEPVMLNAWPQVKHRCASVHRGSKEPLPRKCGPKQSVAVEDRRLCPPAHEAPERTLRTVNLEPRECDQQFGRRPKRVEAPCEERWFQPIVVREDDEELTSGSPDASPPVFDDADSGRLSQEDDSAVADAADDGFRLREAALVDDEGFPILDRLG
jgi:hypothetical protein